MSTYQIRVLRLDGSVNEQTLTVPDDHKVTDTIVELGTALRNTDPSVCAIRLVGSVYRWWGNYTEAHMEAILAASDAEGNF